MKDIIFVGKLLFLRKLQRKTKRMRISQLKTGIILTMPFILLMGFSSCERINPSSSNREDVVTDIALVTTELASILEYFDEAADQTTGNGTPPFFETQNFSKETKIIPVDTSHYDGDGVEFLIDFGPTDTPFKPTQKCLDGRFRGGVVKITLETHYIENTSKSHIIVNSDRSFVVGTESKTLVVNELEVNVERKLRELLNFEVKNLEVDKNSLDFDGILTLEKISGINTPGIFGDHYLLNGSGSADVGDEEFKWEIRSPLKKKVEPGCDMIPVKGLFNITVEKSNQNVTNGDILVDFDPFENESCDRIVRIVTAGKTTDIVLE
ncbi:MAG: hypothetical protein ACKO67_06825 [Bacteroidota bacterium]